jgi:type VI protein secretion system component VasF
MSALSPHDQVTVSDKRQPKFWSGLAERSVTILFAVAAVVAMIGWLYLLVQGLWAAANWLLF